MPARKRVYEEADSDESIPETSEELSTLRRIRGMWEFAAFNQYLFFFGKAVKVEDLDVEDFEDELLKPVPSERLNQIALLLLRNVSSHKGLNLDLLDEYTRRQYVAKAPQRNPFGTEEEPRKFAEFDVFTKIRVLQQLATWTLHNPTPIRDKLDERESEQVNWRIEPFGWDKDDRVYYVLDDNRLYRQTDAASPPEEEPKTPKSKAKSKAKKSNGRNTRSNKKPRIGRRVIETSPEETEAEVEEANGVKTEDPEELDAFCMQRWELIAVSMDEYTDFLNTIRKSRDANEKALVKSIEEHVMPILMEAEEEQKRKEARRMKELEMLSKIATSKRSSRLADKQDKIKAEREAQEAEERRQAELEMAHREQRRHQQMEEARESRRETREQRLREREVKRILEQERLEKEQEMLAKIEAEGVVTDAERGRISERQLKADMAKRKQELESLQQDDTWDFDCTCGVHGQNLDDGTHSIACDKCGTWQHSKCNGISVAQAERDDFHFVCSDCKKKEANPVKLKLKVAPSPTTKPAISPKPLKKASPTHPQVQIPRLAANGQSNGMATTTPLVYPGPPPPAPALNGHRPSSSNGGAPTSYQWHSYQPPTQQTQSGTNSQGPRLPQYAQAKQPPPHLPPPAGGYMFQPQTYGYPYAQSPPQQTPYQRPGSSGHASSTSPRPPSSQYQAPYQFQSQSSQAQLPQYSAPPAQTTSSSPQKAPVLGDGQSRADPRPASTQVPSQPQYANLNGQATTPGAQRLQASPVPAFTPGQGHLPYNSHPGFSPTKQPSPRVVSSPHVPNIASPPNVSAAHFSPPKAATSISPVKHASSPPAHPAHTNVMPQPTDASAAPAADAFKSSALVNPLQTAPQMLPTASTYQMPPAQPTQQQAQSNGTVP